MPDPIRQLRGFVPQSKPHDDWYVVTTCRLDGIPPTEDPPIDEEVQAVYDQLHDDIAVRLVIAQFPILHPEPVKPAWRHTYTVYIRGLGPRWQKGMEEPPINVNFAGCYIPLAGAPSRHVQRITLNPDYAWLVLTWDRKKVAEWLDPHFTRTRLTAMT